MTRRAPTLAGPAITVATATGSSRADRGGQVAQLGEQLAADRLDEDVQDPAAGQADREGVVVADPVALQDRLAGSAMTSPHSS